MTRRRRSTTRSHVAPNATCTDGCTRWLAVLPHPFFGVSARRQLYDQGSAAGTYTIEAGREVRALTASDGGGQRTKTADFSFAPSELTRRELMHWWLPLKVDIRGSGRPVPGHDHHRDRVRAVEVADLVVVKYGSAGQKASTRTATRAGGDLTTIRR